MRQWRQKREDPNATNARQPRVRQLRKRRPRTAMPALIKSQRRVRVITQENGCRYCCAGRRYMCSRNGDVERTAALRDMLCALCRIRYNLKNTVRTQKNSTYICACLVNYVKESTNERSNVCLRKSRTKSNAATRTINAARCDETIRVCCAMRAYIAPITKREQNAKRARRTTRENGDY